MGVLNLTPDSFSDGGRFVDASCALEYAGQMLRDGANLLDLGGESTRPGSSPVDDHEELSRVLPVLKALKRYHPEAPLSVDTRKATVAEASLREGASILNDVTACRYAPEIAGLAAESGCGLVLMHMQGEPRQMQEEPVYGHVVRDVGDFLEERVAFAESCGVRAEQLVLDPGFGFGKTLEHNLALLCGLPELRRRLKLPLLVGLSRKRMIGAMTGRNVENRMAGSLAGLCSAVERGASIVRVHDVKESCDAVHVLDRVRKTEEALHVEPLRNQ